MKSDKEQLRSRGYIEEIELKGYMTVGKGTLLELLSSHKAHERTISAMLLSEFKGEEVLEALTNQLIAEKKLYTKIALSESISKYGEMASTMLCPYLGQVGKNQHLKLPDKPFDKWNYPLPRDIISRTLCKIGVKALNALKEYLKNGTYYQKLEAIDAVGYISYYENDNSLKDDLIGLLKDYEGDALITWKILRALQAFDDESVLALLESFQEATVKQLCWESKRSIQQILRRRDASRCF